MKSILKLRLGAPANAGDADEYTYVEVTKTFDLPFVPYIGMELWFSSIETGDPKASAYREVLDDASDLAQVIIKVERLLYKVDQGLVEIQASQWYEDTTVLHSVTQQFELGYGFSRN